MTAWTASSPLRTEAHRNRRLALLAGLGALITSAAFLALFFPGTLSPDSAESWREALEGVYGTIKPPSMVLVQSLFLFISPSGLAAVAGFSFVQGFLLWFSVFLCLSLAARSYVAFLAACAGCLALFPLWPYANVHWSDVWTAIFGFFGIYGLERLRRSGYRARGWLAAATFFFFLAATFRHNAVSILPMVLLAWTPFLRRRHGKGAAVSLGGGLAVMLLLAAGTKYFLLLPNVVVSPSLFHFALVNPYLGTIAQSDPEVRARLIQTEAPVFDSRFGPGRLAASIEVYHPGWSRKLLFGDAPVLGSFENVLQKGDFIGAGLLRVALQSPSGFLRHKKEYLLGEFDRSAKEYPFHPRVDSNVLGVKSDPAFPRITKSVYDFLTARRNSLIYKHWFAFVLGLGAALAALARRDWYPVSVFTFAVVYALPYLVAETGWEWRYLMPSYLACYMVVVIALLNYAATLRSPEAGRA